MKDSEDQETFEAALSKIERLEKQLATETARADRAEAACGAISSKLYEIEQALNQDEEMNPEEKLDDLHSHCRYLNVYEAANRWAAWVQHWGGGPKNGIDSELFHCVLANLKDKG